MRLQKLLFFLMVTISSKASACSCAVFDDIEITRSMYDDSDYVYIGRVVNTQRLQELKTGNTSSHEVEITKVYKGNPVELGNLISGSPQPTSCDGNLHDNTEYLLFLNDNDVSYCSAIPMDFPFTDITGIKNILDELHSDKNTSF